MEYKTALNNYDETQKRIEVEGKIYSLVKDKRQIGAASDLDVLYAKEMYLMTQKEDVSNKVNAIISTIGLYKVTGGVDLYSLNDNI